MSTMCQVLGSQSQVTSWVKSPSLILLSAKSSGKKVAEYFECCVSGCKTEMQNQVLGGFCPQSSPCGSVHPGKRASPSSPLLLLEVGGREASEVVGSGIAVLVVASAISLQKCCHTGNCTYFFKKGIVL